MIFTSSIRFYAIVSQEESVLRTNISKNSCRWLLMLIENTRPKRKIRNSKTDISWLIVFRDSGTQVSLRAIHHHILTRSVCWLHSSSSSIYIRSWRTELIFNNDVTWIPVDPEYNAPIPSVGCGGTVNHSLRAPGLILGSYPLSSSPSTCVEFGSLQFWSTFSRFLFSSVELPGHRLELQTDPAL